VSKKFFLVIDTDTSWIPKFVRRLKFIGLDDQFSVKQIFPDTSLRDQQLVDECVEAVGEFIATDDVSAIFVDIVIKEEGDLDALGISIARELRSRWPDIPLFNVTGKLRDDAEQELFSEATIEDVDGVLAKVFLYGERASASRFRDVVEGRRGKKRSEVAQDAARSVLIDSRSKVTREAFGEDHLDPRMRAFIDEVGAMEFWGLLGVLLPHAEGTLSLMNPGRSGAFVIKATTKFISFGKSPTHVTTWVIKMARDLGVLQKELDGYLEIGKAPIRRNRYPRLLREEVKIFGQLGGIVILFEGQCETLLEFLTKNPSDDAVEKVASDLVSSLKDIYGDPIRVQARPWGRFYRMDNRLEVKLLGCFQEMRPLASEFLTPEELRRMEAFIVSSGRAETSVVSYEGEIATVNLHGDLNARNVLVTADHSVVLIDFASRRQGHVAADAAKLERDLLLRVADWGERKFYDWQLIDEWLRLWLSGNSEAAGKDWPIGLDPRYRGVLILMRHMREFISGLGCRLESPEYSIAMIYFFLLGMLLPELSVQKRILAMKLVSENLAGLAWN